MNFILRKILTAFPASLITLTAACTTLPSITPDEILRVDDIVNQIQCETQIAFETVKQRNPNAWDIVRNWVAGFSLRLVAEENVVVNPTIGINALPLIFGNVGAATSISGTNTNRRTVNITFGFVLTQIKDIQCRGRTRDNLPLTSNLGIPEWILRSLEPFEDKRNIAQPTLIGSTLDFIVDTSGRVIPGVALIGASNGSTAYGGIFSGGRKDTHTLEISIKPVT